MLSVESSHARLLFGQAYGRLKHRADQRSAPTNTGATVTRRYTR